jgi:hypothetical protein
MSVRACLERHTGWKKDNAIPVDEETANKATRVPGFGVFSTPSTEPGVTSGLLNDGLPVIRNEESDPNALPGAGENQGASSPAPDDSSSVSSGESVESGEEIDVSAKSASHGRKR